ncbi:hypothetical protein B0H11DRAFT_2136738 [Mycena galericulata]|nr:hypothetical protein B0H11DRAFT_2136738 [Mycena galericulata]
MVDVVQGDTHPGGPEGPASEPTLPSDLNGFPQSASTGDAEASSSTAAVPSSSAPLRLVDAQAHQRQQQALEAQRLKASLMQRKYRGIPFFQAEQSQVQADRWTRAVSIAGDLTLETTEWRRSSSGPKITRKMVAAAAEAKAERECATEKRGCDLSPAQMIAEDTMPNSSPGEVTIPFLATHVRKTVNASMKAAGLPTTGAQFLIDLPPRPPKDISFQTDAEIFAGVHYTTAHSEAYEASQTHNTIVLGGPGAGKTMFAGAVAAHAVEHTKVLLLVSSRSSIYTSKVCLGSSKMDNVVIYDPYTLAAALYPAYEVCNDADLRLVREANVPSEYRRAYKSIIIDNFHAFNDDLLWLVYILLSNCTGTPPLLLLLADPSGGLQLHQFACDLFQSFSPYPWKTVTLGPSLRFSDQTAQFLNKMSPDGIPRLTGFCQGPKPQIFDVDDGGNNIDTLADALFPIIQQSLHSCVLAVPDAKLRKCKFISLLKAALVERGIPVVDTVPYDRRAFNIGTFSEKLAVVDGFLLRDSEHELVLIYCTNEYRDGFRMAGTRASKRLVVIHSTEYGSLQRDRFSQCAEFIRIPEKAPDPPNSDPPSACQLSVSDISGTISSLDIKSIFECYGIHGEEVVRPRPRAEHITPPDVIRTKRGDVYVGDINGTLVTTAFQRWFCQSHSREPAAIQELTRQVIEASVFAQRKTALQDHRMDWMVRSLPLIIERLEAEFAPEDKVDIEVDLRTQHLSVDGRAVRMSGRADIVATGPSGTVIIREIKTGSGSPIGHQLQVLLYAFMAAEQKNLHVLPLPVLLNVSDCQKLEIRGNLELGNVRSLVADVIRAYFHRKQPPPPEAVLQRCKQTSEDVCRVMGRRMIAGVITQEPSRTV